jgi:hypothetical protein
VIAPIPATLRAGLQGAQIVHPRMLGEPPTPHRGVESNLAAFVLRPRIDSATPSAVQVTGPDARSATVTLAVTPAIGDTQRVVLLLNRFNPSGSPPASPPPESPGGSYSFAAPSRLPLSPPTAGPGATNVIALPIAGVKPGPYLVRVQVDGADSPLTFDGTGKFVGPLVTI